MNNREFYKNDFMTLYCCDCKELLKTFRDKQFALAIVDPPYGIERFKTLVNRDPNSKYRRSLEKMVTASNVWNSETPTEEYFEELFRVSENQIIWGANNFVLPPSEYFCIWDKKQSVPNFASAEYAWVSGNWRKPAKVFRYPFYNTTTDDGERIHPTQKPVALYEWLFENYSNKGEAILDTHMGSGSIAIAAYRSQVHLTACEIDPKTCKLACERIKRETQQVMLF